MQRSKMGSTDSKGGNGTSAGWQVTLCDPMWHVSSRSGVTTLRTAIHLLLTYLLTYIGKQKVALFYYWEMVNVFYHILNVFLTFPRF